MSLTQIRSFRSQRRARSQKFCISFIRKAFTGKRLLRHLQKQSAEKSCEFRLPLVDSQNNLVGIVSQWDIVAFLHRNSDRPELIKQVYNLILSSASCWADEEIIR